jgi:hypothetical protein
VSWDRNVAIGWAEVEDEVEEGVGRCCKGNAGVATLKEQALAKKRFI